MKEEHSKRQHTDDALRAERDETDRELVARGNRIAEDSDDVVRRARSRADDVLATARARADEKIVDDASRATEAEERRSEDRVLANERRLADTQLEEERGARARALADLLTHERDHTDKRLGAEREQADAAIDSRDEFLAMVTHDLRALLNGVALSAGELLALRGNVEVGDKVHREGRRIQRFTARMNLLVGDLLDVVSIEAGKLQVQRAPHEAEALIHETLETFDAAAAARNITLSGRVSAGSLLAEFDRERILQVLANLVSNAIKFTPDGGAISIIAEPAGNDVRFSVLDNGVGINADKLASLFDRYVQGVAYDRRGLGIGLYISRCIVEAHGGRIWLASEPGHGSVFYFTLPARRA